jgi:hypothetical protein
MQEKSTGSEENFYPLKFWDLFPAKKLRTRVNQLKCELFQDMQFFVFLELRVTQNGGFAQKNQPTGHQNGPTSSGPPSHTFCHGLASKMSDNKHRIAGHFALTQSPLAASLNVFV